MLSLRNALLEGKTQDSEVLMLGLHSGGTHEKGLVTQEGGREREREGRREGGRKGGREKHQLWIFHNNTTVGQKDVCVWHIFMYNS